MSGLTVSVLFAAGLAHSTVPRYARFPAEPNLQAPLTSVRV
ncbi:MAG: hypothetical protein JWN09_1611 [Microbacteriaceae bacterium]|jgi:hypothetical protein|nr:hypothetical protein [Microbacteriaceae bacterium]